MRTGLSLGAIGAPIKPLMKRLESAMLAACRAAGASAWYIPDDFLTLGPELVSVTTASVAGTSGYFYTDFVPVVGKSYQITYQYSVTGGTSVQMSLGGSNVPSSTVGSGTVVFTISASNTNQLRCYSNAATATLAGISVKEVLSAKDYQDSAGTLPSYLGGTVGLGLDATGTVGAELLSSYDLTSANWSAIGTPIEVTTNGFTNASGVTAGLVISAATVGLEQGVVYRVSVPYSKSEGASAVSARIAAGIDLASSTAASGVLTGITTAGTAGFQLRYSGNGTITFGAISIKALTGNHVTQATAGNRPTITRIPRKLGPEKAQAANYAVATGGYDNALVGVSAGGFSTTLGTTQSRVALNFPTEVGKTYSAAFRVVAGVSSGSLVAYSRDSANGGGATINSVSNLSAGVIYSLQFVATSTSSSILWVSSVAAQEFTIDSVSVRELLEWNYALTFDGSNDSLAAAASVIGATLTQPYTFIAWGRVGAYGATTRCAVGDSARMLGISTAGKVTLGHGGVAFFDSAYTASVGEQLIMEAVYNGTNELSIAVNGTSVYGATAVNPPATAPGPTTVGQRGNSSSYWNSDMGGCVVCPAVMTDAQRAAVRKFAAAQMSLTL